MGWGLSGYSALTTHSNAGGDLPVSYPRAVQNLANVGLYRRECRDGPTNQLFYEYVLAAYKLTLLLSSFYLIPPATGVNGGCAAPPRGWDQWKSHGWNQEFGSGVTTPLIDLMSHSEFTSDFMYEVGPLTAKVMVC